MLIFIAIMLDPKNKHEHLEFLLMKIYRDSDGRAMLGWQKMLRLNCSMNIRG